MAKNKITVIIIAKNEQEMLPGALKSVSWADEVLVIDTGSTDKTVQIAKKHGARVASYTVGKNFSDWRNKGLKEASTEWVLYLDADERVTGALKKEICEAVREGEYSAYAIPRRNVVLGKELRHGDWYPDYVKRLFRWANLKKWTGAVHEEPQFRGELGHLTEPMKHIKHEDLQQMVEKTNHYSDYEARLMFEAGHPPMTVRRFLSAMLREFWYRMVRHRAFLDGSVGIIFALYQVFSRFVSYAKLWELQIQTPHGKRYDN